MYELTALAQASENIKRLREERIARKAEESVRSDSECAQLYEKIGKKSLKELPGIEECLTEQEKDILVGYLFSQIEEDKKNPGSIPDIEDKAYKFATVISTYMNEERSDRVFRGIQNTFKEPATVQVSKIFSGCADFIKYLDSRYAGEGEKIMRTFVDGSAAEYFNGLASNAGSADGGYIGALEKAGVIKDTELYSACMVYLVTVCTAEEYRDVSPEELYNIAVGFSPDMRKKLMYNMIINLDTPQLARYSQLVPMFNEITGPADSEQFEKIMSRISPEYKQRYESWNSQYLINYVLGDGDVAKFWRRQLNRIKSMSQAPCGSLILRFEKFTVIEVVKESTAYFYSNEYYDEKIFEELPFFEDETALDDFLKNKTEIAGHELHWRKSHIGDWSFAMTEYINKALMS